MRRGPSFARWSRFVGTALALLPAARLAFLHAFADAADARMPSSFFDPAAPASALLASVPAAPAPAALSAGDRLATWLHRIDAGERKLAIEAAAEAIAERTRGLGTRVLVQPRAKGGGKIVIEYHDGAELDRLAGLIGTR